MSINKETRAFVPSRHQACIVLNDLFQQDTVLLLSRKLHEVCGQRAAEESRVVLETLRRPHPRELFLISHVWVFPFRGK